MSVMKKKIISILICCALLAVQMNFALAGDSEIVIRVFINNEEVEFDVPPEVINNRTMIPARAVFEKVGAEVSWEGSTKKVYIITDDLEIVVQIGSQVAWINDEEKELDSPAVIINNRTLVPIRFIAEELGKDVVWDGVNKFVHINDKQVVEVEIPTAEHITPETGYFGEIMDFVDDMGTVDDEAYIMENVIGRQLLKFDIGYGFDADNELSNTNTVPNAANSDYTYATYTVATGQMLLNDFIMYFRNVDSKRQYDGVSVYYRGLFTLFGLDIGDTMDLDQLPEGAELLESKYGQKYVVAETSEYKVFFMLNDDMTISSYDYIVKW